MDKHRLEIKESLIFDYRLGYLAEILLYIAVAIRRYFPFHRFKFSQPFFPAEVHPGIPYPCIFRFFSRNGMQLFKENRYFSGNSILYVMVRFQQNITIQW